MVDNGSFTAAARAVHVAQPSLSHTISLLESDLGVSLFRRGPSGTFPTAEGQALVGPARAALRSLDQAKAAVSNVHGLRAGRLDLVVQATLSADPAAELVGEFRSRYPGVAVRMSAPDDRTVIQLVEGGLYEVGLTLNPAVACDLGVLVLPPEEVLIAFGPGASRRNDEILDVHELEDAPLIVDPRIHPWAELLLAEHGVEVVRSIETFHRDSIVPLVLSGAGAALVAPKLAERARIQGAIVCRIRPTLHRYPILVHRRENLSAPAQAFIRVVTRWIGRSFTTATPPTSDR